MVSIMPSQLSPRLRTGSRSGTAYVQRSCFELVSSFLPLQLPFRVDHPPFDTSYCAKAWNYRQMCPPWVVHHASSAVHCSGPAEVPDLAEKQYLAICDDISFHALFSPAGIYFCKTPQWRPDPAIDMLAICGRWSERGRAIQPA